MKRYWVFRGYDYYPYGGMDDFQGDFDDLEAAMAYATTKEDCCHDWWQVLDTSDRTITSNLSEGRKIVKETVKPSPNP